MNPAIPAAASRWPIFVFTAPSAHRTFAAPVGARQRFELDRITQSGAGAVRLDEIHRARRHIRAAQCPGDHIALRERVRRGQTVGAAILIDRRAPHHRQHPVPVTHGVGEPFEHHDAGTLTPHEPVRAGIKGVTPAPRRQHSPLGHRDLSFRTQDQTDAARQGQVALPQPQALAGQMNRYQRRRTRRIHRHRRTTQPQQIRDPPDGDSVSVARCGVGIDVVRVGRRNALVLGVVHAHHHRGADSGQLIRCDPGVLERLPGDLQHHPLLRVHGFGLARRDPEEIGVETGHVGQETAPLRRHPARRQRGPGRRTRRHSNGPMGFR